MGNDEKAGGVAREGINEKELIIEDSKTSALIVKQEYANSSFEDITNWLTVNLCSDS